MIRLFVISLLLYCSVCFAEKINVKTYIPPQAFQYKQLINSELVTYFPTLPEYNYIPSLIEHESCLYLTHKRCWNPKSQLKTAREIGAGLSMITKAFKSDGSIRFDSLTAMRNNYKQELQDAKWETIYQRPDIQIRMMILMIRDDYKKLYNINNEEVRLQMTDSAYNGGLRDVNRSRQKCSLASNCNSQLWFNNVENYIAKSNKILYGNRSAIDINKHHVHDVFHNKLPKYKKQYFTEGTVNANTR